MTDMVLLRVLGIVANAFDMFCEYPQFPPQLSRMILRDCLC